MAQSSDSPFYSNAKIAQEVEHVTEDHTVGGSTPSLGTTALALSQFTILEPDNRSIHRSG